MMIKQTKLKKFTELGLEQFIEFIDQYWKNELPENFSNDLNKILSESEEIDPNIELEFLINGSQIYQLNLN